MHSLKVSKFGGSSMADASAMKRSAAIIQSHGTQLTVVSATYGTTNQLEDLMELSQGNSFDLITQKIEELSQQESETKED